MSILRGLTQARCLSPCPPPLLPWRWQKVLPRGVVGKFHGHLFLFQRKKKKKDCLSSGSWKLVCQPSSQSAIAIPSATGRVSQSASQPFLPACLPASQDAFGLQSGPGFPPVWSHQLKCTNICDLTLDGYVPEAPILEPASSSWKPISPSESAGSTSLSGFFF